MTKHLPIYSPLMVVQNVANRIAVEDGVCRDEILRIRLAGMLAERPELINLPFIAGRMVKHWHTVSNKTLNKSDGLYIPPLFVKVAKNVSVRMRDMTLRHIEDWDAQDLKLTTRFNSTMDRKRSQRNEWRRDFERHPGLRTLGEIERELYGHVEASGEPFTKTPVDRDDDDEDDDA